jgi:lipoprotein-anchoring transpeptidase ErfK/SrfK
MVPALCFGLFLTGDVISGSQSQRPSVEPSKPVLDPIAWRRLATQVGLDRANFSPGELDAAVGSNTRRALASFQKSRNLRETGEADDQTAAALGEAFTAPIVSYVITAADAAGPFVPSIPEDMMKKSELSAMSYTSVLELLGERFHVSPRLLQRLNPGARFIEGESLQVPNVVPFEVPEKSSNTKPAPTPKSASTHFITVSGEDMTLTVQDASGGIVFQAPVTVGSENDPLPVGEWKVNSLSVNPPFNYNPALFWDADVSHAKAKIAPGPNNPVGVAWIDLSKEHYGIHGAPEPSRIGHTQSHGCIRLTNWDVMRLTTFVSPGTKVVLR